MDTPKQQTGASLVAQLVRIHWFDSWVGQIPWRRDKLPTPAFLGFPGGSGGKESACNKTWVQSLGWEDPLEKGTATHFSILAWRIPRTISPWGRKALDTTDFRFHNHTEWQNSHSFIPPYNVELTSHFAN